MPWNIFTAFTFSADFGKLCRDGDSEILGLLTRARFLVVLAVIMKLSALILRLNGMKARGLSSTCLEKSLMSSPVVEFRFLPGCF